MTEDEEAERAEARVGEVLDGRYRLDAVLGMGGLGVVDRALHLGLERAVALKVLHADFAQHEEVLRRFAREARVLSTLDHPHVVRVLDFGAGAGGAYLAMELLAGRTLADLLDEGPLPIDLTFDVARQILEALTASHARGVLHRDLKPANVFLVDREGGGFAVKILDFGLAKMTDAESDGPRDATITRMGSILGTPAYMSPEQVTSQPADARADVYSMGILLYEMLTGLCPFDAETPAELMRAHLVEPVPEPASLRPGLEVTDELAALLDRALAKKRAERFADARAMLDALVALPNPPARVTGSAPWPAPAGTAHTVASHPPDAGRSRLRWPDAKGARALLLGLGVVVLGAGGYALVRGGSEAEGEHEVVAGADDGSGAARARDPLDTIAPALAPELSKVSRGVPLEPSEVRALREYQSAHPEDVTASLLLAHDYAGRAWWGGALERYRMVDERDPGARGSRWFLVDLVRMTTSDAHGDAAAAMIETAYGRAALPAVERALADPSLDADARRRLEPLAARLAGGGAETPSAD